jgi:hypothetical protein
MFSLLFYFGMDIPIDRQVHLTQPSGLFLLSILHLPLDSANFPASTSVFPPARGRNSALAAFIALPFIS